MKPPTFDELEALMPWAHIEETLSDDGECFELVVYTGLMLTENEEVVWMPGMEDLV